MLVAAVLIVLQKAPAEVVQFSTPPARLVNVLPSLSKAVGKNLECAAETRNELVVIRVKGCSRDDLLKRIAEVCSAEWQPTKAGLRLTRPVAITNREAEEEIKTEAAEWAKPMDQFRKDLKNLNPVTAASMSSYLQEIDRHNQQYSGDNEKEQLFQINRMRQIADRSPMFALGKQVLASLSPDFLARLPFDSQVVYSDPATQMEIKSPVAWQGVYQQFSSTQAALASFAQNRPGSDEYSDPHFRINIPALVRQVSQPRFIVSLKRSEQTVETRILAVDQDGQLWFQCEAKIDKLPSASGESSVPVPNGRVELAGIAQDAQKLTLQRISSQPPVPTGALSEALTHPEKIDPLALGWAAGFLSYADQIGSNLVVRLADTFEPSFQLDGPDVPAKKWLDYFRGKLELKSSDGWIIGKPTRPHLNRLCQLDRDSLGATYRAVVSKRSFPFDTIAEFFAKQPVRAKPESWLVEFANIYRIPGANEVLNRAILRLYGSLSQNRRDSVWNGGASLARLSPAQTAHAEAAVYGSGNEVNWLGKARTNNPRLKLAQEIFGQGLPRDAILVGKLAPKETKDHVGRFELWLDPERAMLEDFSYSPR